MALVRAVLGFVTADETGGRLHVYEGDVAESDSPVVSARPEMWRPLDVRFPGPKSAGRESQAATSAVDAPPEPSKRAATSEIESVPAGPSSDQPKRLASDKRSGRQG